MESGQDISAGTRRNSPAAQVSELDSTESNRTTAQVKLRLAPDDALRLRTASDASGRTLSDFVVTLLDGKASGQATVGGGEGVGDALAEVSRLANAVYNLTENLRLSRADLGRGLGLVKNLFNESQTAAEQHRHQLHEATVELRSAITRAEESSAFVSAEVARLRTEISACAKRLARIG